MHSPRSEGEREIRDEAVRGRLQRDSGEAAAQVRFAHRDSHVPGGGRIGVQPGQGELVGGAEQHDRVGLAAPGVDQVRIGRGEIERGVHQLTGLIAGRKVGTRDEVQAGKTTLVVRHVVSLADARKPGGRPLPGSTQDSWKRRR